MPIPDDAELLLDANPLPAGLPSRLVEQLASFAEVDRLKTVLRQSPLAAAPVRPVARRPAPARAHVVGRVRGRATPEARFAKAMDRLQPLLLNWLTKGGTWRTPGVTADTVRTRKACIAEASTELGSVERTLIDEGERRGWVEPGHHNTDPVVG